MMLVMLIRAKSETAPCKEIIDMPLVPCLMEIRRTKIAIHETRRKKQADTDNLGDSPSPSESCRRLTTTTSCGKAVGVRLDKLQYPAVAQLYIGNTVSYQTAVFHRNISTLAKSSLFSLDLPRRSD